MENYSPSESPVSFAGADADLFLTEAFASGLAPAEYAVKLLRENLVPFVENETGVRILDDSEAWKQLARD